MAGQIEGIQNRGIEHAWYLAVVVDRAREFLAMVQKDVPWEQGERLRRAIAMLDDFYARES
jgi:hypothetical protein